MASDDKKSKPKPKQAAPKKAAAKKPAGKTAADVEALPPLSGATAVSTKSLKALAPGGTGGDGTTADYVPSTFDEFFSGVATSFANAQHTLDQRTAEYLAEIRDRPELLPTAFRIAKVSADMKFAVESVDSTSVGILIFKDTNSTTVQNQQSVHFEMVAAPTPAGTTISTPAVPLMLSAGTRGQVFAAIKKLVDGGDQTGAAILQAKPDRVLIFVEDPATSLYLTYADDSNFGVWRLAVDTGKLAPMRPFGAAAGALAVVCASLKQLEDDQEDFLQKIK